MSSRFLLCIHSFQQQTENDCNNKFVSLSLLILTVLHGLLGMIVYLHLYHSAQASRGKSCVHIPNRSRMQVCK